MSSIWKLLCSFATLALLAGCSPRSGDATPRPATLVGKWEGPQGTSLYFEPDGHVTCTITNGVGFMAKYYEVVDATNLITVKLPIKIQKHFPEPPPFHTNTVVSIHRAAVPDEVKTDSQLTLLYGDSANGAALAAKYPDFKADYERLSELRRQALESDPAGDLVRSFLGDGLTNDTFTIRVSFPSRGEMILNPEDGKIAALAFVFKRAKPE